MDVRSLRKIERLNYVLGVALVAAAALLMSGPDALGVLVGVLLTCLNFSVMRGLVQRWLRAAPEHRGPQSLILLPKMVGMMLAVFLAVYFLPVTGIGVLIGFSVFLGSIAIETVRFALSAPPGDASGDPPPGGEPRE